MAHALHPIKTQYNDWTGTSAADTSDTRVGLDKIVGVDPDRWWILALDIYAAEPADLGGDCVTVYALDREKFDLHSAKDLDQYARANNGTLPVTSFVVSQIAASRIILESFKRFGVQLRSNYVGDWELNVEFEEWLNDSTS